MGPGSDARKLAMIYAVSRCAVALIFFYHGLVPKILFADPSEVEMNQTLMPGVDEQLALVGSGVAELIFSALLLLFFRTRWFNYLIVVFGSGALLTIVVRLPHLMTAAFNPFSTNVAIVALAVVNLLACPGSKAPESAPPS